MKKYIPILASSFLALALIAAPASAAEKFDEIGLTGDSLSADIVETVRPEIDVVPGQSVKIVVSTPSGKSVSIAIIINGKER